jgi:predicted RNA binding protein YcfA (HicA-like mRNA interferase family)
VTPGLPTLSGRVVVAALERGGSTLDRVVGSHHVLVHQGEPRRAVTVPVHGNRDLKAGTLRSIIRQAGLTVEEFRDLL